MGTNMNLLPNEDLLTYNPYPLNVNDNLIRATMVGKEEGFTLHAVSKPLRI